jgi:hypothetical protein
MKPHPARNATDFPNLTDAYPQQKPETAAAPICFVASGAIPMVFKAWFHISVKGLLPLDPAASSEQNASLGNIMHWNKNAPPLTPERTIRLEPPQDLFVLLRSAPLADEASVRDDLKTIKHSMRWKGRGGEGSTADAGGLVKRGWYSEAFGELWEGEKRAPSC